MTAASYSAWLAAWSRAVLVVAARRAQAVWAGLGVVGAVVLGPTGLHPRQVTGLALQSPPLLAALGAIWLLAFAPVARVLVRQDGAAYLRALPHPRGAARLLAGAALVGLQAPWLALWLVGDGVQGGALAVAWSLPIAAIAAVTLAPRRARWPHWRGATTALVGAYARGLVRRGGGALVRGAGLALLAGAAAGLVVRNNGVDGRHAATVAASVLAVALAAAWTGALLPLLDAHRQAAWLAATLGVSHGARRAALAACVVSVFVVAAVLAAGAAGIVVGDGATAAWIGGAAVAMAAATALAATCGLLWAERSEVGRAARVVVAAALASAFAVLLLGVAGLYGLVALAAFAVIALASVPP